MSIMQRIHRELELEMILAPAVAQVQDGNMRRTGLRQQIGNRAHMRGRSR